MSILIIGVGEVGAKIAEKINQEKISGVNCAIVVNNANNPVYPTITKGVNIWDGENRHPGNEIELAEKFADDKIELIKSLIIDGTKET
jgi:cell division GTPase FtsZ